MNLCNLWMKNENAPAKKSPWNCGTVSKYNLCKIDLTTIPYYLRCALPRLVGKPQRSLLPWKLNRNGWLWVCRKNCNLILVQFYGSLVEISRLFLVKQRLKVRYSKLSCYHSNIFKLWWILVHRRTKDYLSWEFQVSSPNGHVAIAWVTKSGDRQTLLI